MRRPNDTDLLMVVFAVYTVMLGFLIMGVWVDIHRVAR
jgi:hypothetical protein